MAERHARRAREHHRFAAELVDVQDCGDGGEEHCYADDAGREEGRGVAGGAEGGEDGGGVVEDWGKWLVCVSEVERKSGGKGNVRVCE